jgi:hypothetical protein
MIHVVDDPDLPGGRSRWKALLRLVIEYAFWFAAAILLKVALSASVSFPYPSPLWIPVLVLALQHGLAAGLLAALIAAAVQLLPGLPSPSLAEDLYAYIGRVAFEPVAWTAMALFIGQIRSREIRTMRSLRARLVERTRHADGVAELSTHLRQRVDTLERQIAASADASVADVAEAMVNLEHAGWEDFSPALRQFIQLMTGAGEFTVYLLRDGTLHPAFASEGERTAPTVIKPSAPLFVSIVTERRLVSAATPDGALLLHGIGIFAGPLFASHASGPVTGMLTLSGASADELPEDIEHRFALASSELSRLVPRIKLINTWHEATNGHAQPASDTPALQDGTETVTTAVAAPEGRTSVS